MKVVATRKALEEYLSHAGESTATAAVRINVGFVPTMGALHAGHISLVRRAKEENEIVVVSIFINPTQFNDPADLQGYPRTPEHDMELLRQAGADVVFMPTVEEIYPEPDTRIFDFGQTDKVMEGATRPGHFNGVAQVVSRLFDMVRPGRAYFGQKDYQQVAVIRALVKQLSLSLEIVTCPTVREEDGLAMSSRNMLLDREHRNAAPKIYAAMQSGVELMKREMEAGREISPREVEKFVTETINSERLLKVIYFKLVNARTLQDADRWDDPDGVQGCVAVQAGNVRLIDNMKFV